MAAKRLCLEALEEWDRATESTRLPSKAGDALVDDDQVSDGSLCGRTRIVTESAATTKSNSKRGAQKEGQERGPLVGLHLEKGGRAPVQDGRREAGAQHGGLGRRGRVRQRRERRRQAGLAGDRQREREGAHGELLGAVCSRLRLAQRQADDAGHPAARGQVAEERQVQLVRQGVGQVARRGGCPHEAGGHRGGVGFGARPPPGGPHHLHRAEGGRIPPASRNHAQAAGRRHASMGKQQARQTSRTMQALCK